MIGLGSNKVLPAGFVTALNWMRLLSFSTRSSSAIIYASFISIKDERFTHRRAAPYIRIAASAVLVIDGMVLLVAFC